MFTSVSQQGDNYMLAKFKLAGSHGITAPKAFDEEGRDVHWPFYFLNTKLYYLHELSFLYFHRWSKWTKLEAGAIPCIVLGTSRSRHCSQRGGALR
jgi:hypothetical protein